MNERLQQLASKARIKDHWSIDEGRYLTNYLDEQKFAELIVRECADVAFLEANSRKTQRAVLQHFGVEE